MMRRVARSVPLDLDKEVRPPDQMSLPRKSGHADSEPCRRSHVGSVVFDRGVISIMENQALAEAAREGGLKF